MKEFNANVINEENAKDAMEAAVDIVKDVAAKSGSGIISGKGIVAGVLTAIALVGGGVMLWRKKAEKKKEELRIPDAEVPVELSDEDIEEITTAE